MRSVGNKFSQRDEKRADADKKVADAPPQRPPLEATSRIGCKLENAQHETADGNNEIDCPEIQQHDAFLKFRPWNL